MSVLVDSSVWIAAASPKNRECMELKRMIRAQELIYTTKPIQTEVCQGARSKEELISLRDAFLGFPYLEVQDWHWDLSALNYFNCRKKGITPSTLDCLIATLAKEYQVALWSLDKDISRMQPVIGFELFLKRA